MTKTQLSTNFYDNPRMLRVCIFYMHVFWKKKIMHNEPRKNTTILLKISERVYRIEIFLHAGISTEIKTHFPACST